ncbi:MAG: O-methyltransferase [Pirellulales bacterium]
MTLRSRVSCGVAAPLVTMCRKNVCRTSSGGMPFWAWRVLPSAVQRWIEYRVIGPTSDDAERIFTNGHAVGDLCRGRFNGWTLAPSTLLWLWNTLNAKPPQRIVECGSGLSTLVFARYARLRMEQGDHVPQILSIEHDAQWLEAAKALTRECSLDSFVHFVHAPLKEQNLLGRRVVAYSLPGGEMERSSPERFDFVLIDGPPASVGRLGSLAAIAPCLADGAAILLDDAFRPGEQAIWKEWRSYWPGQLSEARLLLLPHGLAKGTWCRKRGGEDRE